MDDELHGSGSEKDGIAGSPGKLPGSEKDPNHLVLMLSGLAAKHFKIALPKLAKVDDLAAAGHWSECWRCDLLGSNEDTGTFYFILTNARTLYSLIVPVNEPRINCLVASFVTLLHHQYRLAGLATPTSQGGTFQLVRGQPRSLIGSQNELIRSALHLLKRPDIPFERHCRELNLTPMLAIPECFPDDAFAKAIASDPPFRKEGEANIVRFPGPSKN